jgi:hypothetical protein
MEDIFISKKAQGQNPTASGKQSNQPTGIL